MTGEAVEVEADERRLVLAALRLYLPPLAGLLLGPATLRGVLGHDMGIASFVAACLGLAAGLLVARALTRDPPPIVIRRNA